MTARTILLVALGGGIGSVFRYLTGVLTSRYFQGHFPLATFITNILGCFLIGLIMGFLVKSQMQDSAMRWFLVTGFCGGYTTFSAFGYENIALLQGQHFIAGFGYIALSVIAGLAAVWLGLFIAQ
jgi:CrcB protein